MEYSQRTPCLLLLISALFSVGECLAEGDGERDEWSCRGVSVVLGMGSGASHDWTLSSGVNRGGRACGLTRNAVVLSVLKALETL